jgi:hypothetical protein
MQTPLQTLKGAEKLLAALAIFGYLTAAQLTRLLYKETSISFVRKTLHDLAAAGFVLALPRQSVTHPIVYTPTGTGYTYAAALGIRQTRRVRPQEEKTKAKNAQFLQHALAVNDAS